MEPATLFHNPGLSIAFAMAAGIAAQALARHVEIPGIVILIATGVLLGPDVAGIVQPGTLGPALQTLVGFAVAVILFEGGMGLNLRRLRRAQRPIRQIVTLGALVTAAGGTLAAKVFLDWDWRTAILFGTLVIVTGPTVINPLLKRLKVEHGVATVLEAEGILVDAIGAITAIVALEIALSPSGSTFARGLLFLVTRLAFGAVLGLAGGFLINLHLRFRNLVPEGLENVFTLSLVLALFQGANALMPESGIAAVTAAGMVVGNLRSYALRDLMEFKEQLTVLLIGMLFVLLAADVRLEEVRALGIPGLITVAALMLVVRPLNVLAGTWGTELTWRQRVFMGWIGPRGIVAAAVASLFAAQLDQNGIPGGPELRAMVFLVIAITVLFSGLSGGIVARLLSLRRKSDTGWVILGANELARATAHALVREEEPVVLLDTNPEASLAAEKEGLRIIHGNGLEERTLLRAEIDTRAGALGLTPNEEVNLIFAQKAKQEGKLGRLLVSIASDTEGATAKMTREMGGAILFGRKIELELWATRLRHQNAVVTRWRLGAEPEEDERALLRPEPDDLYLALTLKSGNRVAPISDAVRLKAGDEATVVVDCKRLDEAALQLRAEGWERMPDEPEAAEEEGKADQAGNAPKPARA